MARLTALWPDGVPAVVLRPPTAAQAHAFLVRQRAERPTYTEVGWTRMGRAPSWARVERRRVRLGEGEACWTRAKAALGAGEMFGGWVRRLQGGPARPPAPGQPCQPETGETVALLVRLLGWPGAAWGLYALIANRVLYVLDEPARFGFGYGTLPGHFVRGEERFLLERDARGEVWLELTTFSRAALPWPAQPFVGAAQRRGARHYAEQLLRAVQSATGARR